MTGVLHEKRLVEKLRANAGKRIHTLLAAPAQGYGRTYLLRNLQRSLAGRKDLVVVPLFGIKSKAQAAAQVLFTLFDRRCEASEFTARWLNEGGRDKLAAAEKAIAELTLINFVFLVDDIDALDAGAIEVLRRATHENVTFIMSRSTTRKLREQASAFVKALRPEALEMRPLNDRAIGKLLNTILQEKRLTDPRWAASRRRIVKASSGLPGILTRVVETLSREEGEAFNERLGQLAKTARTVLYLSDYAILFAIAGMAVAIAMHATTESVFRLLAASLIGALSLAVYRVLLSQAKTSNPWE